MGRSLPQWFILETSRLRHTLAPAGPGLTRVRHRVRGIGIPSPLPRTGQSSPQLIILETSGLRRTLAPAGPGLTWVRHLVLRHLVQGIGGLSPLPRTGQSSLQLLRATYGPQYTLAPVGVGPTRVRRLVHGIGRPSPLPRTGRSSLQLLILETSGPQNEAKAKTICGHGTLLPGDMIPW